MSETNNLAVCGNCIFYVPNNENSGNCHGNPPTPFIMTQQGPLGPTPVIRAMWPPVAANEIGCGKHPLFGVAIPLDHRLAGAAEGTG